MVEVLQDPTLKKIPTITHGFFTRLGGVSEGIYASLNCAYKSNDNKHHVRENRKRAAEYLGYELEALMAVKNVHGNHAVIVEKLWQEHDRPDADAVVTNQRGILLGSDSADCPTILFADETASVIAVAHAGWKGAKSGIIESTIEKMLLLGANTKNISAAISPCIAQNSYEVSADYHQQFLNDNAAYQQYFKQSPKENHFQFDLPGFVKDRLTKLHLKSISTAVALDTYTDEKRFFSCRRALHKGESFFGGQLSCIALK